MEWKLGRSTFVQLYQMAIIIDGSVAQPAKRLEDLLQGRSFALETGYPLKSSRSLANGVPVFDQAVFNKAVALAALVLTMAFIQGEHKKMKKQKIIGTPF